MGSGNVCPSLPLALALASPVFASQAFQTENTMHPLNALKKIAAGLLFLGVAFVSGNAVAQQASEMDAVKAASKAFYMALTVFDNGEAMEKVWAHTPYVTFVGRRSKSIMVGRSEERRVGKEC